MIRGDPLEVLNFDVVRSKGFPIEENSVQPLQNSAQRFPVVTPSVWRTMETSISEPCSKNKRVKIVHTTVLKPIASFFFGPRGDGIKIPDDHPREGLLMRYLSEIVPKDPTLRDAGGSINATTDRFVAIVRGLHGNSDVLITGIEDLDHQVIRFPHNPNFSISLVPARAAIKGKEISQFPYSVRGGFRFSNNAQRDCISIDHMAQI